MLNRNSQDGCKVKKKSIFTNAPFISEVLKVLRTFEIRFTKITNFISFALRLICQDIQLQLKPHLLCLLSYLNLPKPRLTLARKF